MIQSYTKYKQFKSLVDAKENGKAEAAWSFCASWQRNTAARKCMTTKNVMVTISSLIKWRKNWHRC